jgi:hypothetical protein
MTVEPVGQMFFVLGLIIATLAADLMTDRSELGYFARRYTGKLWRQEAVVRGGLHALCGLWLVLLATCLWSFDFDERPIVGLVLLAAIAFLVWRRASRPLQR